ncbi:glycosyltransferase family 4 protein [Halovivax limisalsi]|uniref:glycosyltransferase family 4 protein n=1 Tax=Halovivax limisalsi TaxID=1453760 RepID=UPI001FFC89B4|nr:glycosyltransferase family 1 protein [Halovivax limisalsi]
MRVGICSHFIRRSGGKQRFTENLLSSLAKEGDLDLFLVETNTEASYELDLDQIPIVGFRSPYKTVPANCLHRLNNIREINKYDLDIIHCPGEVIPPYFWRVDAKKIITFGGDEPVSDFAFTDILSPYHMLSLSAIKLFSEKVSRFTIVSDLMRGNIKSGYGIATEKIKTIPHGINRDVFYPREEEEIHDVRVNLNLPQNYILHVSSFRKVKNTERIVRAFAKTNHQESCLVFAGKKRNEFERIKMLTKELGIGSHVQFLGYVGEELPALYSGAEALCQPSHRETFSFPVAESLACGTPVITSPRIGALEDLPYPESLIVDPGDTESIAEVMDAAINSNSLMSIDCSNWSTTHLNSWKETANRYMELYENVLK